MNKSELANKAAETFLPHDTSVDAILTLASGTEYEIMSFDIEFQQYIDFKGEPQSEEKGGLLSFTLNRAATDELNNWMFGEKVPHSGIIRFASFSRVSSPVLLIEFTEGYCVDYQKSISEQDMGIMTRLVISAKKIKVNGIDHQNDPKYKSDK